ncbi:rCG26278 [Rattus norvegicus]|uniref:RCG26278 n=1 Tax=Rattus norvegicus TaxID=10116 RepID=A6HMA7_RAT|nr:rCG26278 [Rattus norvegicus]
MTALCSSKSRNVSSNTCWLYYPWCYITKCSLSSKHEHSPFLRIRSEDHTARNPKQACCAMVGFWDKGALLKGRSLYRHLRAALRAYTPTTYCKSSARSINHGCNTRS